MTLVQCEVAHDLSVQTLDDLMVCPLVDNVGPRRRGLYDHVNAPENLLNLVLVAFVLTTLVVDLYKLDARHVRACEDDELRPPRDERTLDRHVIYLVVIKDVQEERPLDVRFAEVVKGDVFLAVVAVKPLELSALAEPLISTEIQGKSRLARASGTANPDDSRFAVGQVLDAQRVPGFGCVRVTASKREVTLEEFLVGVVLRQGLLRSQLDGSSRGCLGNCWLEAPYMPVTVLHDVSLDGGMVVVALIDVRVHVEEHSTDLVDALLDAQDQVPVLVETTSCWAALCAPTVPDALSLQSGMDEACVVLVEGVACDKPTLSWGASTGVVPAATRFRMPWVRQSCPGRPSRFCLKGSLILALGE